MSREEELGRRRGKTERQRNGVRGRRRRVRREEEVGRRRGKKERQRNGVQKVVGGGGEEGRCKG